MMTFAICLIIFALFAILGHLNKLTEPLFNHTDRKSPVERIIKTKYRQPNALDRYFGERAPDEESK